MDREKIKKVAKIGIISGIAAIATKEIIMANWLTTADLSKTMEGGLTFGIYIVIAGIWYMISN
ncbi:hypothetical protein [Caldisalinibacter kiritimatiensis]|uniref:Uncharacterized protein n=1 Tax=Caldisalinibacter kiritimatiensis TaxID=1304284 RepID=R1CGN6_9FIRM|nr:hypothetical protein [Caldisalinibacter kiritimatiensis]EOD01455.1 hypothetical protein L21TH_0502 [Caldisalinibacter kiritimatiensis]